MSRLYRTSAFPAGSGPDFVNGVFSVTARIDPQSLLQLLHAIETEAGRVRDKRWGPRTLDLDLLSCGDLIWPDVSEWSGWHDMSLELQLAAAPDRLILPHPRLHERAFVLVPLADIDPTWRHPVLELTAEELLEACAPEELADVVPLT